MHLLSSRALAKLPQLKPEQGQLEVKLIARLERIVPVTGAIPPRFNLANPSCWPIMRVNQLVAMVVWRGRHPPQ